MRATFFATGSIGLRQHLRPGRASLPHSHMVHARAFHRETIIERVGLDEGEPINDAKRRKADLDHFQFFFRVGEAF